MDDNFMNSLVYLREWADFLFPVTSGYRCPEYNKKIGGGVAHTLGRAVDIHLIGSEVFKILEFLNNSEITGIGLSQQSNWNTRFIHIDDLENTNEHPRPWVWTY